MLGRRRWEGRARERCARENEGEERERGVSVGRDGGNGRGKREDEEYSIVKQISNKKHLRM